ncbi:glutathione S-transferase [Cinnamomum micranthum f. kanehirae]|uniref:glutathione transferase n=1 Tax=Cinnamomum micranthum f. kanehirae TaxID=337451 RepID=A0A3S3N183_9MAGN|nr:glutathione S-transferase [Cinnamomum micranthum f. kanehirae]
MPMVLALQAPARHLDRPDPIRTHPLGVPQQMVALEVGDNTQVSNDGSDPRIWQGTVYKYGIASAPEEPITPPVQMNYTQLLINGQLVDVALGKTFPTLDPTTREVIVHVDEGDPMDVNCAVMMGLKFHSNTMLATMRAPALEDGDLKLIDLRAIVKDISHEYTRKAMEPIYRDSNKKMTIMVWMEVEAHQFDREALKRAWELFNKPIFGLTTNLAVVATSTENPGKGLDVYEARQGQNEYLGGETFMLIDLHHLPYLHYKMEQSSILISFLSIVIMQIVVEEAKEPKNMVTDIKNATSLVLELCGTFFIGKLIQSLSVTLFIFLFSIINTLYLLAIL